MFSELWVLHTVSALRRPTTGGPGPGLTWHEGWDIFPVDPINLLVCDTNPSMALQETPEKRKREGANLGNNLATSNYAETHITLCQLFI